MQKEELARANADTALNGRCDTIAADVEEVRDIANHKVDTATYTAGQAAQDTAIQQNKDAIAHVTDSLSGYVKTETYTTGQAAQDAKITAAQTAADKANTNIGDWETDHPGQTISQCATSLENETAENAAKADANAAVIGDWNAEHPGKTIAQEVTRLNGAIPDVSGFVTTETYTAGQAAQDAEISGKASKITTYSTVVFPHFVCSEDYKIQAGGRVTPKWSLIAYIINPYITSTSTVLIQSPTLTARFNAFGFTPADVMVGEKPGSEIAYNIVPYHLTRQHVNLSADRPTVTVENGLIEIDFTNAFSFDLIAPNHVSINNVAFNVDAAPVRVTVDI